MKGFKQFIMRGNVLDLAVAVVIGAAFGAVVTALVKDLITPLIAAIVGKPDFSAIQFEVNGSKFLLGDFVNAIVSFLLIAAAVYFFVILPMNALMARARFRSRQEGVLSARVSSPAPRPADKPNSGRSQRRESAV